MFYSKYFWVAENPTVYRIGLVLPHRADVVLLYAHLAVKMYLISTVHVEVAETQRQLIPDNWPPTQFVPENWPP